MPQNYPHAYQARQALQARQAHGRHTAGAASTASTASAARKASTVSTAGSAGAANTANQESDLGVGSLGGTFFAKENYAFLRQSFRVGVSWWIFIFFAGLQCPTSWLNRVWSSSFASGSILALRCSPFQPCSQLSPPCQLQSAPPVLMTAARSPHLRVISRVAACPHDCRHFHCWNPGNELPELPPRFLPEPGT